MSLMAPGAAGSVYGIWGFTHTNTRVQPTPPKTTIYGTLLTVIVTIKRNRQMLLSGELFGVTSFPLLESWNGMDLNNYGYQFRV